ncbi:MAG: DUF1491 family protein [Rhizobiales bacterium]|nr:DUF1491 family protein [Hyphomicrobiales bacterium]
MPRLRSDFWVAVLRRRAEAAGAYVSIARRGAEEAGAIFVSVDRRDGRFDLYGPAPQMAFDEARPSDRLFTQVAHAVTDEELRFRIERELRFDPDVWVIDIEDRQGRSFLDVI